MTLSGKIDRIERNQAGEVRIIDFKTGETARKPETTHHRRVSKDCAPGLDDWRDLQLPMYVYWYHAQMAPDEAWPGAGYFVLSKRESDIGYRCVSEWDEQVYMSACEAARCICTAAATADVFPRTANVSVCRRCPYAGICQR
jgi:hypothetical protein